MCRVSAYNLYPEVLALSEAYPYPHHRNFPLHDQDKFKIQPLFSLSVWLYPFGNNQQGLFSPAAKDKSKFALRTRRKDITQLNQSKHSDHQLLRARNLLGFVTFFPTHHPTAAYRRILAARRCSHQVIYLQYNTLIRQLPYVFSRIRDI